MKNEICIILKHPSVIFIMRKKYKCPWENMADATVAESRRLRPSARRHGIPKDTLRTCLKCLELFQVYNRAMGDIPGNLTGRGDCPFLQDTKDKEIPRNHPCCREGCLLGSHNLGQDSLGT